MNSKFPEWAVRHKKPGTELRFIHGRYYLYEVTSRWNPDKKRAQKITGKLLGKITEEKGFVASTKSKVEAQLKNLQIKAYGANYLITQLMVDCIARLKEHFPSEWEYIIPCALFRLQYQSPLKNMHFHFAHSFLSEQFSHITLTPRKASELLRNIGAKRNKIIDFFKAFIHPGEHILFDVTHAHSKSEYLSIAKSGYNSQRDFEPQINLMLIFSPTLTLPVYYRILPGNIRDVKAFKLSLQESSISDAVLVADKGFYSKDNVNQLDEAQLKYILPMKRNNNLIDYSKLSESARQGMDGYFKYKDRYIWYYCYPHQKKLITIFLDESLKNREERDYLNRIETHPEDYTFKKFQEKNLQFGTLAMMTNLQAKEPEEIYSIYKTRISVEVMANVFKNLLDADRSYMRNEQSLEGWMFINYIALFWYYKIYQLLNQHKLLSKYSPSDLLMHLAEIKKVKIDKLWHLAEITSTTDKLLKKLGLHIT